MMTFGQRLKKVRQAAGLSRVALSRELDIDPSTVQRWEEDRPPGPRLYEAIRAAQVCGCDVSWLTTGAAAA